MTEEDGSQYLSEFCSVLLKGGHRKQDLCTDLLFSKDKMVAFDSKRLNVEKHGTGCVLSSAITANLANGMSLETACEEAKQYVFNFLQSDLGLIGQHSYNNGKVYS